MFKVGFAAVLPFENITATVAPVNRENPDKETVFAAVAAAVEHVP